MVGGGGEGRRQIYSFFVVMVMNLFRLVAVGVFRLTCGDDEGVGGRFVVLWIWK